VLTLSTIAARRRRPPGRARLRARYNEENDPLSWFRRKRKQQQDDAEHTAVAEQPTDTEPAAGVAPAQPDTTEEHPPSEDETGETGDTPKRRRRRGTRGGRGRKRTATTPADETSAEPASRPQRKSEARAERSSERERRSARTRRRQQQLKRAPLPEARRQLVISVDVGEQRVAVLEDEQVAEVYLERPERRSIAGNIYLGVVDNVLPGMEAAFVEIGLEKNGFLYVDEIVVPELEGKRHGKKIQDLISRGEQLLVQAVKDPMKTKGARLTTEISLPGRFLVYVPNGEGLGVSRRLDDAERNRLKDVIKGLDVKEGGIIVRTAAEGASAEDIERDFVFLQRLWKTIQARSKKAKAPELLYQEAELPLRIVRDLFAGDFVAAHIDHERTFRRIVGYLKKTSPHMVERVHRYKEKEPLFTRYGIDREIESTLSRRVDLPSGGYLVFDYAEAFTVVDVNTGRFVGSRSKTSTQRLEDTATKNNLEAVKEVVRQLRLRDIGGIIVIDFIDMANPKNRAQVEEALREELERDRTKTYVVEISPLGLVEMTRQNVTDGPREILTRKCPVCAGDGIVLSDETIALRLERRLRELAASGSRMQAYKVALHPRVLSVLAGPGGARLTAIEEASRRRFFLVPVSGHVHVDHFEVVAEGKTADLQPDAPVAPGDDVEVKLVEVDLHDATAGVGKLNGYDVVVAGAAKLVGKKAKAVAGAVLDGQVLARLADAPAASEAPISFESEAEKPTRAPGRKKAEEAVEAPTLDAEGELEPIAEIAEDATGEAEAEAEVGAGAEAEAEAEDAEAPKKKTRRGTRGGRRRKKPAAAEAAGDGEAPAAGESSDEPTAETRKAAPRKRRPKIHVPEPTNGDSPGSPEPVAAADPAEAVNGDPEATPRKKTRRGTRGGRRRKKPATEGVEAPADDVGRPPEPVAADGGYVPMSEWLDDFDG
jgi:ribonuclease G